MRSHPGVAAKVFEVLGDERINIEMISTSPIKISCVISADRVSDAVNALHRRSSSARRRGSARPAATATARGRRMTPTATATGSVVLGATGLVGTTILELLAERDFPVAELRPLASARSRRQADRVERQA